MILFAPAILRVRSRLCFRRLLEGERSVRRTLDTLSEAPILVLLFSSAFAAFSSASL